MKSFIRRSAALTSLVGGLWLGLLALDQTRALALTETQVVERLRPVPVFAITDANGTPLVATPEEGQAESSSVTGVFISQQDAQQFLDNLKTQQPQLAGNVRVTPVSLAEIYQLAVANSDNSAALQFYFVPMDQQVQSAITVLERNGQNGEDFEGVPLFFAESTQEGGYLTIQQGDQRVIPIFFSQEDLQGMLARITQQEPTLASQMRVQVTSLENLIGILQQEDSEDLNRIVLVPPRETLDYIRTLQPAAGGQPRPSQPPAGSSSPAAQPPAVRPSTGQ